MSFTNGEMSAADIAAVTDGASRNGFGGDGAFWIIILFLFAMMGGWNGNNGNWGSNPAGAVQAGFDQASIMSAFGDINTNLNTIAMNQQNCCCENRQAISDLKYTIAQEACETRSANSANTQAILDKLCQQEIDALKAENSRLQTEINLASLRESQTAQTAQILADNARQTVALEQYLNPVPVPAYAVANPNCCQTNSCGCNFS